MFWYQLLFYRSTIYNDIIIQITQTSNIHQPVLFMTIIIICAFQVVKYLWCKKHCSWRRKRCRLMLVFVIFGAYVLCVRTRLHTKKQSLLLIVLKTTILLIGTVINDHKLITSEIVIKSRYTNNIAVTWTDRKVRNRRWGLQVSHLWFGVPYRLCRIHTYNYCQAYALCTV